jgi:hypothetical protein
MAEHTRTHLKVIRLGCPSTGGLWLHTMCATGSRGEPGAEPAAGGSSLLRPTTCSVAQVQAQNDSLAAGKVTTVAQIVALPPRCAAEQTGKAFTLNAFAPASNECMQAANIIRGTPLYPQTRPLHPCNLRLHFRCLSQAWQTAGSHLCHPRPAALLTGPAVGIQVEAGIERFLYSNIWYV